MRPSFSDFKCVVVVATCRKYLRTRFEAVEQTWLRRMPQHWRTLGVYCDPGQETRVVENGNRVCFRGGDAYADVPAKDAFAFEYCVNKFEFDFLIRADDDTFVHTDRFSRFPVPAAKYVGPLCPAAKPVPFAHGSLTVISRDLMSGEVIEEMRKPPIQALAEMKRLCPNLSLDQWVIFRRKLHHCDVRLGMAIKAVHGVSPDFFEPTQFSFRGRMDHWPTPDNDRISCHYISPKQMRRLDKINRRR